MKKRIEGLKAVVKADKMGFVEGVLVTPQVANRLLTKIPAVTLMSLPLKTVCKLVN